MFTGLRIFLIGLLVAVSFATAADAHRYHRHPKHRGDGFDVGDAIVGGLIVGGIIAVLGANKKKKEDERTGQPLPPAPYPDDAYPDDRYPEGRYPEGSADDRRWEPEGDFAYADPRYADRFPSERAAIEACGREAEALGGRYGASARVESIGDVSRQDGDTVVRGSVRIDDRRVDRSEVSGFACYADGGTVTGFRFEGRFAAL